jgi:hypothetical protein
MAEDEEDKPRHDYRFCPYCFQHQVDLVEVHGDSVYCEICGIDVEIKELVKQ